MNDNEINIAIAEACGWTQSQDNDDPTWWTHSPTKKYVFGDTEKFWPQHIIPNYCTDLNAMHEAEKTLTDEQKPLYVILMLKGGESKGVTLGAWWCLHSIARQRAEAFLRTLGRWKE